MDDQRWPVWPDWRRLGVSFYAALMTLMLSGTVHLASIAGITVHEKMPIVWSLHLICLAVGFLSIGFRRARRSFRIPAGIGLFCAGIAITTFAGLLHGSSTREAGAVVKEEGHWVLKAGKQGPVIRILSEVEAHKVELDMIRGFSGMWVVFSAISVALLAAKSSKAAND